ncbi:MAG: hypothetical protein A2Y00_10360 [Omnitrophica WOR_2 bacterium GWF2_43_52]|nr:MAG: hypothetical protein A2062_02635 [Omnitrophica WOR_2 bacterium GWA2_44_7]OGX21869.1 MAG: hypothetical protein A2Y00_10360 [Omnitrophica WOR_2 bacterium GWF2_43_52]OGX58833.1 MAG: hypothetical protein A2460_04505 [Omnitrophica WOR_2 bacterium RIFOXYC2_FULL_43_9]HAH20194.1 hypothetical protein [Candidatus Omnitrophota bacterium]HBG63026.1 hypothetical protein [Candidatus Omnitrophota bacterium]
MTIKDIARLSRVSMTTVSRVINNEKVSRERKEKILKIIQRYEYQPDPYAQYLGRRNNAKITRKTGSASKKVGV